jgi:hypothetical protein
LWWLAVAVCPRAVADEGSFSRGPWPFVPLARPEPPPASPWCLNPIDAFVWQELAAAGLQPNIEADRAALLRRVTFDLTGLFPTPAEQAEFLADPAPDAYERLVDRLLASPVYGERQAQFWLDLVRYAETDGFKADGHRPLAYKYRDYVIAAFNADLPYDRFLLQQLAGDELEPANPQALAATGFLRLYPDEYNAANLEQRRQEILDDLTETVGLALLGLTVGCARCHDHKFDELSQEEYYRFQAFFAALVERDDLWAGTVEAHRQYATQLAAWEQATAGLRGEIEALIGPAREALRRDALGKFRAEIQAAVLAGDAERTPYQKQIAAMAMKQVTARDGEAAAQLSEQARARYEQLCKELAAFDALRPAPPETFMAVSDVGPEAPPTCVLAGGNWQQPLQAVDPGFPALIGGGTPQVAPLSGQTTGRRAALARWLVRADHPLTARVAVNRIWQQHLGVGLIPTANDFGAQGEPATHPQLLDWLAAELVESGWSLKHIHRLIVTSATYRQSSFVGTHPDAALALARDPSNRLLWRARRRRLEGEAARDCMLQCAGTLERRMYGPSARPELPDNVSPNYAWQPDTDPASRNRRSIYVLAKRNLRYPLFEVFDQPDLHHSCPRRPVTTTAPQALYLLHSELVRQQAAAWADRLLAAHGADVHAIIEAAFRQAFCRAPQQDELSQVAAFMAARTSDYRLAAARNAPGQGEPGTPTSSPAGSAGPPHGTQGATAAALPSLPGNQPAAAVPPAEPVQPAEAARAREPSQASGERDTTAGRDSPDPGGTPQTGPTSEAALRAAVADFCHVLLNTNEFMYVD